VIIFASYGKKTRVMKNRKLSYTDSFALSLDGTIKHHLETYELILPEIVDILKNDLYVDDLATGTDSVNAGKELYEINKRILKEGGFNLRKWVTNNLELQTFLDEKENLTNPNQTEPTDCINPKVNRMGHSCDFSSVLSTKVGLGRTEYR